MNEKPTRMFQRRRRVHDAIVLVAGRGSRLRPLTDTTPKCLLEIGGTPLLERLLGQLADAGVERAWLVTGYASDVLRDAVSDREGLPEIHFVHNPDWDRFNNAESVRCALDAMQTPRPVLICDGDVWIDNPDFLREMTSDGRPNVLGVELRLHNQLADEDMKFQLEPVDVPWYSRRVVGLGKQLVARWCHGESIGVQVVGGEAFTPFLEKLNGLDGDDRRELYYEDVFARLIPEGSEFYTQAVQPGAWVEIDTPEDLEAARRKFGDLPEVRVAQ